MNIDGTRVVGEIVEVLDPETIEPDGQPAYRVLVMSGRKQPTQHWVDKSTHTTLHAARLNWEAEAEQ